MPPSTQCQFRSGYQSRRLFRIVFIPPLEVVTFFRRGCRFLRSVATSDCLRCRYRCSAVGLEGDGTRGSPQGGKGCIAGDGNALSRLSYFCAVNGPGFKNLARRCRKSAFRKGIGAVLRNDDVVHGAACAGVAGSKAHGSRRARLDFHVFESLGV